jgi:outer membrane protein assembly factor BamB
MQKKASPDLLRFFHFVPRWFRLVLLFAILLLDCDSACAENWPAWRGSTGMGISQETNLPLRWSTTENVLWKTPLPDRGNSTPIIWRDRVFVTQAIEKEGRRTLMCFDRATGNLRWQNGVVYREKEPTHSTNPYCSASPVTDGELVIASYGSAGVSCYDFEGKEIWHRNLGPQLHIWGNASSPVISGDLCFLNVGPGERTFLIALNKRTGDTVWQHNEPGGHFGEPKQGEERQSVWIGSWSTAVLYSFKGREELLLSFPKRLAAFDPRTGKELWTCSGLNPLVYTSPIAENGIVVSMGGYSGSAIAVKAGGNGDVTETHRLWRHPRTKQRIGSGVIFERHIYILNDPGVAECFELESGKLVWEERLAGPGPKSDNWSSMVLANGSVFAINQSGDAFAVKASPKFQPLSTNSLGETTMASLAPSDNQWFIRTYQHLWCIGERSSRRP